MKIWKVLNKLDVARSDNIGEKIIKILLENRGLTNKRKIDEFLNPKLENVTVENVDIDKKQLKKALERIYKAIDRKEEIIVFGDYDVDGITGTAILWETLHEMKACVLPYIPDRIDEGYGLSIAGIKNLELRSKNIKLIITVDNGIVANEAVEFANKNGIDVIITDHHTIDEKLPDALAIVHTTKLCGAGVAWLIAQELKTSRSHPDPLLREEGDIDSDFEDRHLELAALGTVADMVPLTGANRAIVRYGLDALCKTKRPGLRELFKHAGCEKDVLGVYEVGFLIGPRLNAAGRIENAMDSLRLLCTKDPEKAKNLAYKLEVTNRERQMLMKEAAEHALSEVRSRSSDIGKILIVAHESYQQGVIGLVAGKLVEEFYRPSIVISRGEKHSKASVRSIEGFNIIEFLRTQSEFFINVGGHPMAAGFTIETEKIVAFRGALETAVEGLIDGETLTKKLKIDCEIPLDLVTNDLYMSLQQLAPFGMKNPEPVFCTRNVAVKNIRVIGRDGKHLKLTLQQSNHESRITNHELFDAIAFGMGELGREIKVGDIIDVAYTIDENTWNGNTKLQLKVKDIKV